MPEISILMPVYNADRFVAEAMDSILSQTFADWELIVINDGSTDNSKAIIESYTDARIRYIENESNLRLIKTLNKGIDLCRGRYIARMDADDIAATDRLQIQYDFLEAHPDYTMCGSNATIIDNAGRRMGTIYNQTEDSFLQVNMLFSDPFIHPSMLIRSHVLHSNKYDEEYIHVEDYELWCRIAPLGKIANIGKPLLKYRWHDTNISVVYREIQCNMKNRILREQLKLHLDIDAGSEELYLHQVTFDLYSLGRKQNLDVKCADAVANWFARLIEQNRKRKKYNRKHFAAFLWSRWIVLCISQKRYGAIFTPGFINNKLSALPQTLKLVYNLSKKR